MEKDKVEYLINMINDMDIKDKLRLAICMTQSKWSGLIYNTKENYEKTKANDKQKNEFCKRNNIRLIRIKYDEGIAIDKLL